MFVAFPCRNAAGVSMEFLVFAAFLMLIGACFCLCILMTGTCVRSKRQSADCCSTSVDTIKHSLHDKVASLTAEKLELLDKIAKLQKQIDQLTGHTGQTGQCQLPVEIFLTQTGTHYHVRRTCQHVRGRHGVRALLPCQHCGHSF